MKQVNQRKFWQRHRRMLWPLFAVLVLLLLGGLMYVLFPPANTEAPGRSDEDVSFISEPTEKAREETIEPLPSVQNELDQALASVRGTHSVVIWDAETDTILATHQPNETFFTASIYKLYVAYLALLDIQAGVHDPNEPYNQGRTRMECIVAMLRDSDSPCPEQMWEEQGRAEGTVRLQELGLTNTDLVAITTTAADATSLLLRLYDQQDLSETNTNIMLESLRDFPERDFRQGLPSALDSLSGVTVYNKPGIYDEGWLDAAILSLPNERNVVISIFSDAAYYQEVRSITTQVIAPLYSSVL